MKDAEIEKQIIDFAAANNISREQARKLFSGQYRNPTENEILEIQKEGTKKSIKNYIPFLAVGIILFLIFK
jgi:hypothetical protein